jgi:hypothetical protein
MSTVKQEVLTVTEPFYVSTYGNLDLTEINDSLTSDGYEKSSAPRETIYQQNKNRLGGQSPSWYGPFSNKTNILASSSTGIPSSQCKATVTGRYKIIAYAFSGGQNTNFPHFLPIQITYYNGNNSATTLNETIQITTYTINGREPIDRTLFPLYGSYYYSPSYATGGNSIPEVTFTSSGSNTSLGSTNQHQYIKFEILASRPTTSYPGGTGGFNNPTFSEPDGWQGTTLVCKGITHPTDSNADKPFFVGSITRIWEGNKYIIDGTNGDTPPTIQNNFILTANAKMKTDVFGQAPLIINASIQEQSQSVITGVQSSIEGNFSLSASANLIYHPEFTLNTQIDLLATTYRFLYSSPLSLELDYSLSSTGGRIRRLPAELILSADTVSTQTAGLIYDISVDYTWDDFAIDGKFKDNLLDGGIQYTWDGVDYYSWGTWPNDNWDQTDISWDEWPSDTWNGSERIVTEFNTQNTGNAKRGGIGSLLSTTSLSENAAKLKTGASTLTSDFSCDGSPSGKMGGTSTMISDFIVNSFANYIINNAQNIDGAFNATLLANYIAKFVWSSRSDFNLNVTPTFKPSGVTNAQCIAVVNALANAKYGPSKTLEGAFDPEFTARLFFTTDPYQIYKVLQETRQIFVDAESRGIEIAEEIRLNSIPAEDRDYLVPQETRSITLRIPPMVDRTTTPKVRRE